jgi:hypothetical protein
MLEGAALMIGRAPPEMGHEPFGSGEAVDVAGLGDNGRQRERAPGGEGLGTVRG